MSFGGKHLDALIPTAAWESFFQPHNFSVCCASLKAEHNSLLETAFWWLPWSVLLTQFKQQIIQCPACQWADTLSSTQLDPLSHPVHSPHPSWTAVLRHVDSWREEGGILAASLEAMVCSGQHHHTHAHWHAVFHSLRERRSSERKHQYGQLQHRFLLLRATAGPCFKMRNIFIKFIPTGAWGRADGVNEMRFCGLCKHSAGVASDWRREERAFLGIPAW